MSSHPGASRPQEPVDFKLVFDQMSGMCLILDPGFTIVAQNREHARATHTTDKSVVRRHLFDVFPDNPNNSSAVGVAVVRQSLMHVLKTRQPDQMPVVRYDVRPPVGPFQTRYWKIVNTPILGPDGYVQWIINRADDVTEIIELRARRAG
jgi:PAS domain-containing protein